MRSEQLVNSDLAKARKIVWNLLTEADVVNNRLIAARVHVLDLEQELKQITTQMRPGTTYRSAPCNEAQPDPPPAG